MTPLYLDGHAVIITGYDEDHGTVYYWDPETGESGNGAVGDYIQGWSVNGVKE
ncbi:papain-like cysteine protease family protein [uncultured Prevotella sp.]|uniref:papain-like cysteine protease family protein n=1 Tax=uncultured Prevotella sp. TaxID=159272 RepID=UPI0035B3382C